MGKYGGTGNASSGAKSQDREVREARRNLEQEGGFGWTEVVLLGVMGATALFSFDRAYQKHTERHEEEEKREKEEEERKEEEKRRRKNRRRDESVDGRGSRARSLDKWDDFDGPRDVDEHGFYVGRGRSGKSRADYDRDRAYYDRAYDRGHSLDYHDRYYGGSSRRGQSTW
ncbi:hypothetical protein LIA77_07020 [Sarocladium implicatum]|nr:hypothetical protein LIA77_07020 [Sarocladium implicatum]